MHALKITNLNKTYDNGVVALKDINLTIKQGDFFALLGPNGAGKSTTIGIIASLVKKTSGHISIFDHDIDSDPEQAKLCLGIVPQELNFSIFEKTLNVILYQAGYYGIPRQEAKTRAEFYLEKLGLQDKQDRPVFTLSGGMKRRLMIARALVNNPKLLILDEPTAGVDIETRHSMWTFLQEINRNGTTIILTTHYLEEAENLCRTIAIIDKGCIVENTSKKDLLATLTGESFILYLKNPLLQPLELINFRVRTIDETTLEVDLLKNHTLNELFILLTQHGIEVTSIRNKTTRLEELYLRIINNNHHG